MMGVEIPDRNPLCALAKSVEGGDGNVVKKQKPIAWSRVA